MKKLFTLLTALLFWGLQSSYAQLAYGVTYSQSDFNNAATTISKTGGKSITWDNGIKFTNGTFQWDNQTIVIALNPNGIPDKLTASFSPDGGTSGEKLTISTSSTNGNFTQVYSTDNSGNISVTLPKDAKYIQLVAAGNFNKKVSNLSVSELKYLNAPINNTLDFGNAKINSAPTTLTTSMEWCNVPAMSTSLNGDAAQFEVALENNASIANYGTATISVTYKHNLVGTHTATLTVSNGTYSYDIALSGTTEKKDQQILWAADYTNEQITLPVGKEVLNAATATSGYAVTYSSSDESILAITNDGTAFKALAAGTATLTASQAGDANEWNAVSATKTVVITEKKVQNIAWTDNLSRLKVGGEAVTLSAVVRILTMDGDNEIYTDAPERTALLTYTSGNDNVVSVSGNILTIIGEGETTLTATVPGDDTYEGTSVSMPVRVRAASALCDAYVLNDNGERSIKLGNSTTYSVNGPAYQLEFQARHVSASIGVNLKVEALSDGNWTEVDKSVNLSTGYKLFGPYDIPRNTTQIRFTGAGSLDNKIKDVVVTMARYLETSTPAVTVEKSIIGDVVRGEVKIQYSNLPDDLPITLKNNNITLSQETLDNLCGEYGEKVITFTATPTALGTLEDEITISDEITGLSLSIPVTIHTQRNTQTINWEDNLTDILTTDNITLTATAETSVSYTSSDESIAYIDADNRLIIIRNGVVTLTAHAEESDKFEAATLDKEVNISLTTPVIIENPTITEPITYGTTITTDMLVGGSANVEGSFHVAIAEGTIYEPGIQAVPVVFNPTNTDWYTTAYTTVGVVIIPAEQTIVWNDVFDNLHVSDTIYLTATASTEVSYSVDNEDIAVIEGNKLYFLSAGDITLTATAESTNQYNAAYAERTIHIKRVQAEITQVPTVANNLVYGQALREAMLEGGEANCEGHFEWAEPDLTQAVGNYWQEVIFVPEAAEVFDSATCLVYIQIESAQQEIVWNFETTILEIGQTIVLDASATSGYTVSYELSPTDIAALDGNTLTALSAGTLIITAQQDGIDEDGFQNYLPAEPVSFTVTIANSGTSTQMLQTDTLKSGAHKVLRNGVIYILRGDEIFTLQGHKVQ